MTSTSVSRVLAAVSACDMLRRLEILTEQEKGARSERVSLAAEGRGRDKVDGRDAGLKKFRVDRSVESYSVALSVHLDLSIEENMKSREVDCEQSLAIQAIR